MFYVAWKRGLPQKIAHFVLFHPIKKCSFNLLCVLDLLFRMLAVSSDSDLNLFFIPIQRWWWVTISWHWHSMKPMLMRYNDHICKCLYYSLLCHTVLFQWVLYFILLSCATLYCTLTNTWHEFPCPCYRKDLPGNEQVSQIARHHDEKPECQIRQHGVHAILKHTTHITWIQRTNKMLM